MSTKIPWADETWNPITGCTPISEGCANCYAKRMFGRNLWDYDFTPGTIHYDRVNVPMKWKEPKRVFVCSMGDLFHADVARMHIHGLLAIMEMCHKHTFMLLTKRPQRMKDIFSESPAPRNVWIGVTAEDQLRWNERVSILETIPAAVRFASVEPMLGPVNICANAGITLPKNMRVHWVIAGPETGPGKRECDSEWIYDVAKQCATQHIPFFDKRDDYLVREWPEKS